MLKWIATGVIAIFGASATATYISQHHFESAYECIIETSEALDVETEEQLDEVIYHCTKD